MARNNESGAVQQYIILVTWRYTGMRTLSMAAFKRHLEQLILRIYE